jgi:hypothetical protein
MVKDNVQNFGNARQCLLHEQYFLVVYFLFTDIILRVVELGLKILELCCTQI